MHPRYLLLIFGLMVSSVRADPSVEKATSIRSGEDLQKAVRLAIRTYDGERLKT